MPNLNDPNRRVVMTILCLGLAYCLIFGVLQRLALRHSPLGIAPDGKLLYVGAKLLAHGKNPYSTTNLIVYSAEYAPGGKPAGHNEQAQLHLPATLAVIVPFSFIPWSVYPWLFLCLNAFCIPLIGFLCLTFIDEEPTPQALVVASILALPPIWQNIALGQIALPILAFGLLGVRMLQQGRTGLGALFTLLGFMKLTCTLPLVLYFFCARTPHAAQKRAGILLALGLFILINATTVLHIGIAGFRREYRASFDALFHPGGFLDPAHGNKNRIDIDSTLGAITGKAPSTPLKAAVSLLIVGAFWLRFGRKWEFHIAEMSLLFVIATLIFYHHQYDSVLLIPALILAYQELKIGRRDFGTRLFAVMLVFCFACMGNHSVVSVFLRVVKRTQPSYLASLSCILVYVSALLMSRSATYSVGMGMASPAPEGDLKT